jgi:hypothetical protein
LSAIDERARKKLDNIKKYYKISTLDRDSFYLEIEQNLGSVVDMIKECEVGDGYCVEVVEMEEEKFLNLPEFTGF